MNISNDKLTIKYQTAEEYCRCCNREFKELEYGEVREFDITLKQLFEWADWTTIDNIYHEEIENVVEEYLHNTISFYSTSVNERIRFCDGGVDRIQQLVLVEIKKFN
ncbi:hypothetical protein ABIA69_003383 [Lysinibacillus parviboronicapiens]|uniref:Uncharacterized protein n=1 Tax=Lysinibacillus parviboronicapiens TaxID=436516 RepID=A0ABV2PMN0_9BACI